MPMKLISIQSGLVFISMVILSTLTIAEQAVEPDLKKIMQGLRDDTVLIADGLLTDDFAAIEKGAAGIADHARIPALQIQKVALELGVEMSAFKQFDEQVHDLSLTIASAAREQNRARAIDDFQAMLNGCLACHTAYRARVAAALSAGEHRD